MSVKRDDGPEREKNPERNLLSVRPIKREATRSTSPPNLLPDPILSSVIENVDNLSREVSAGNARYGSDGDPTLDPDTIGLDASMNKTKREEVRLNVRRLYPPP